MEVVYLYVDFSDYILSKKLYKMKKAKTFDGVMKANKITMSFTKISKMNKILLEGSQGQIENQRLLHQVKTNY